MREGICELRQITVSRVDLPLAYTCATRGQGILWGLFLFAARSDQFIYCRIIRLIFISNIITDYNWRHCLQILSLTAINQRKGNISTVYNMVLFP